MHHYIAYFEANTLTIITPLIVFLSIVIAGYIVRKVIFSRLLAWSKTTKTNIDDIIIEATKGPFIIWCLMLGMFFALKSSQLSPEMVRVSGKILMVLGISSVTLVLAQISTSAIRIYASRFSTTLGTTTLPQNIARVVIILLGILVILNSLGISIAPILATLGVGGLAVALALQDTLANAFAGLHIIVTRQIKVGDYVKLDSGQEGYVMDIGWRTTQIRMNPNNMVIVPNVKVTQSVIINYHLPTKDVIFDVALTVHGNSDLNKVEQVCLDVARQVLKTISGGMPGFEPIVRFDAFADSGITLKVILRASEFGSIGLLKHEFIRLIHSRFVQEKIIIPYPVIAINYDQEKVKQGGAL